jgi:hypothetical protein
MPEMEMWSYSQFGLDAKQGDRIRRAGINFGAPGNRRDADGTLWLEHPHVGDGNAPQLGVEGIGKDVKWFRRHSSQVTTSGASQPWIAASGLIGEGEIVITPSLRRPLLVKPGKNPDDDTTAQEPLLKIDYPPLKHTVRLHFNEPDQLPPGDRVFNVMLQGETVLENFDPAKEGGGVVREFKGVVIGPNLRLTLKSAPGSKAKPVLCGVEFVAE